MFSPLDLQEPVRAAARAVRQRRNVPTKAPEGSPRSFARDRCRKDRETSVVPPFPTFHLRHLGRGLGRLMASQRSDWWGWVIS